MIWWESKENIVRVLLKKLCYKYVDANALVVNIKKNASFLAISAELHP